RLSGRWSRCGRDRGRAGGRFPCSGQAFLEQGYLGDLAREALLTGERGAEPRHGDGHGTDRIHLAGAEAEDIGVVLLAGEARGFRIVAERSANASDLVRGDGGAGAAAAD